MGVREWTIVIGVIVAVTVLFWLAARWRKRRYDDIYGYHSPDDQDDDHYGSELPSGGARTVGYRDEQDIQRTNTEVRQRAEHLKPRLSSFALTPREQQPLFDESPKNTDDVKAPNDIASDGQVPLLLDPADEHSAPSHELSNNEKASVAEDRSDDVDAESEIQQDEASSFTNESFETLTETDDTELEPTALSEPLDVSDAEPIEESSRPLSRRQKKKLEKAKKAEAAETASKSDKKADKKSDTPTEKTGTEEPAEVIVINLMIAPETPYEGTPLLRALTESGMRFGEMDIFHYCGRHGDESPKFSMANLLNPGVFDMDKFSELRTHALCFFFELQAGQDNIGIYETMLSVISNLKAEIGGEMRDDQRSVFTIQMREHCRNRIRDFQRRHLVKKH